MKTKMMKAAAMMAVMAGCMTFSASAQEPLLDAFVIEAGAGFYTHENNSDYYGGWTSDGLSHFWEIEAGLAYEKFLWKGFFVRPEVSLFYRNNYNTSLGTERQYNPGQGPGVAPGVDLRPDLKPGNNPERDYQIGAKINCLAAWRQPVCRVLSVDILTGPLVAFNIYGATETYGLRYTDLHRAVTFTWRSGIALNIGNHFRVAGYFNINTGHNKTVELDEEHVYWTASGEKYANSWTITLGYRF